jgi:micrococcal nuclease
MGIRNRRRRVLGRREYRRPVQTLRRPTCWGIVSRRRTTTLILLLILAGCVSPAPAHSQQVGVPEGMHFAASARGTVFYAVTCDAWTRFAPADLRFFRTVEEARAAGLRPSRQPDCAAGDTAPQHERAESARSAAAADVDTCIVERVIDGDTLVCDGGVRVRLLLIDAPELSQGPWGMVARRELESLAPAGTPLRLERDVQPRDRYGRTLAYLWLEDGRMLNEQLLRAGVAVVSIHPPNVRHVERLRAAVVEARAAKVGLWATSAFDCSPADHRNGRC